MPSYRVRAWADDEQVSRIRELVASGEIERSDPDGRRIAELLRQARRDPRTGEVLIEAEHEPGATMDRPVDAILADYLSQPRLEAVRRTAGPRSLIDLPGLLDDRTDDR